MIDDDKSFDKIYEEQRNFLQRTFGRLTEKGVRGNIFLLIMTTIGSAFFLLPYTAKTVGLFTVIIFLLSAGLLSYLCSLILYFGFAYTKAKTYNECMEKILGEKMGLFSAFIIFLHIIGSAVSTWMFSFKFLSSGLYQYFEVVPSQQA